MNGLWLIVLEKCMSLTWVIVLEFGQIVDILVNNDPEGVGLVMRRNVACTESLGHDGRPCSRDKYTEPSIDHYQRVKRAIIEGKKIKCLYSQKINSSKKCNHVRSKTKTAAHSYKRGPFGLTAAQGKHYHMLKTPRGHFRGPCLFPSSLGRYHAATPVTWSIGPSRSGQSSSSHWQDKLEPWSHPPAGVKYQSPG